MSEKKRKALLETATAIYDTIAEAGDEGIPSGHLYAMLAGIMHLDIYQAFITVLKKTGKIKESGYVLTVIREEVKNEVG